MTTIKTTIKKEIATIILPKCIELRPITSRLYELVIQTILSDYINVEKVLLRLEKTQIFSAIFEEEGGWFLRLPSKGYMHAEKDCKYTNTYKFYTNQEKEIEITSYEQGCYILSDIFTPLCDTAQVY